MKPGNEECKEITAKISEANTEQSEDYVEFYANRCVIVKTPWDMHLRFSQIGLSQALEVRAVNKATVIMTYPHAKALLNVLSRQIEVYERANGEIRVPAPPLQEASKAKDSGTPGRIKGKKTKSS